MKLDRINVGLVGAQEVGKTSIAQIYATEGRYPRDYHMVK